MKPFYLIPPLVLAGLMLLAAAPDASAKAFKTGMVDPATVCVNGANNDPCNIYFTGPPAAQVDFQDCTVTPPIPVGVNPSGTYPYCLWMYNATDKNLKAFDFSVPLPIGWAPGDTLDCVTIIPSHPGDPTLTPTTGCDQTFGVGDTHFDISFTADTFVAPNAGFFLLMDFAGLVPSGPAGVIVGTSVPVPEPGALALFGLGLLGIGVGYGWKRRRANRGIRTAA